MVEVFTSNGAIGKRRRFHEQRDCRTFKSSIVHRRDLAMVKRLGFLPCKVCAGGSLWSKVLDGRKTKGGAK